eukprot:scaffold2220_cov75-Cylindrotheca_fusiformis.AAC.12
MDEIRMRNSDAVTRVPNQADSRWNVHSLARRSLQSDCVTSMCRSCKQDDDNEAFQTVFYEFPRISSAKTKSKSANSDDDYDITDLDNLPMKFDEDDLDVWRQ